MRELQSYLDPSCFYVASDLTQRGEDTLILDLEDRPLPSLPGEPFEVAVFAGVLEYLSDVPGVVSWICGRVTTCLLSYECVPRTDGPYERLRLTLDRAAMGWVNGYTEMELKMIFANSGFSCIEQTLWYAADGREPIFVFRRNGQ